MAEPHDSARDGTGLYRTEQVNKQLPFAGKQQKFRIFAEQFDDYLGEWQDCEEECQRTAETAKRAVSSLEILRECTLRFVFFYNRDD